jgi:uroporphyrinogen III methyltransferase/synthase
MKSPRIQCYLIGAGPGDPGLLTVRACEVLSFVDVVIYDSLVNEVILDACRLDCEKVFAGKRAGRHFLSQDQIHAEILKHLQAGKTVARLKGGDPFVFARGGEEMEVVDQAGYGFEIIPGVTSGTAVPAYAGIPLTHREWASHVTFVTAHERKDSEKTRVEWKILAQLQGTLVVYMGAQSLKLWASRLIEGGLAADTPAAFIQWGTRTTQRGVFGCLDNLPEKVEAAGLGSPAIAVIGKTVSLRERLMWFEAKPLFGKRVIVTRSQQQNTSLRMLLRELGAEVLEIPTISIHQRALPADIQERIKQSDWLAFSSSNGVQHFLDCYCRDHDLRDLAGVKLAAVGPSTAALLEQYHLKVDFIPSTYRSEMMGVEWPETESGRKVLYLCGNLAANDFQEKLSEKGLLVDRVDVYETREEVDTGSMAAELYRDQGADWITFCSSSAVRAFQRAFPDCPNTTSVAAIGPVTGNELSRLNWPCHVLPQESTLEAMVQSMVDLSAPTPA